MDITIEITGIENRSYTPETLGMQESRDDVKLWAIKFKGSINSVSIKGEHLIRHDPGECTINSLVKEVEDKLRENE